MNNHLTLNIGPLIAIKGGVNELRLRGQSARTCGRRPPPDHLRTIRPDLDDNRIGQIVLSHSPFSMEYNRSCRARSPILISTLTK
ncbi:hypothetical protein BLOT_013983 [Blomia tropicalis]|nr:hypothetical protein BLOT_013983 [Blomia tropicalis]